MVPSTPVLQVKDLETVFTTNRGSTKAVDKVSFEVFPGETVALVGESGSGKSVTALSLLQLINTPSGEITGGKVLFNSEKYGHIDLIQLSEKRMQRIRGNEISMIFQEPMSSLNPVYTCGKQVAEVLLLHKGLTRKEARERTIELFRKAKLPRPDRVFDAYPHELSGGQKQRVMIAMAMACKPSLLIADEPTTALDVTVQAQILLLLDELRVKEHTAVLFITHDLNVVAEIADRVLVMYQGKIVEQGKVADIFSNPQHPYTKSLLACRPKLTTRRQSILPTVSDFMHKGNYVNEGIEQVQINGSSFTGVVGDYDEAICDNNQQLLYMQEPPLLHVENLKVYFPAKKNFFGQTTDYVKALDGVTLEAWPGETIGIVGESGCGKTTLGRALLRLIEPTEGSVFFNGRHMYRLNAEELRKSRCVLQMIFQDPYTSLNPLHTVGKAVMEPMLVHNLHKNDRERRERATELLETVGISPEHFQRYPHEFSGGQRQRICIARALALQPKCIVCDEAVSSLDVSVQAQVLNLLNRLKRELQITYIFITHDLSVASHMSDRIMVMKDGKIIEEGTPAQLFRDPRQEYTRTLLKAIPRGDLADILKAQEKREKIKASDACLKIKIGVD